MIALDTSVVIALFLVHHEHHDLAVEATPTKANVPVHVLAESYSALTRLPEPHRADPDLVAEFLTVEFPRPLTMRTARSRTLPSDLAKAGVRGGATYDAVVGLTAADAGTELLTLDARARTTYVRLGVPYRLLTD